MTVHPEPAAESGPESGTAMRVVLADDDELFRVSLAALLDRHGYSVVAETADATRLLAAVGLHQPDLAVVDIRMPPTGQLEGLHAAIRIRAEHPGTGVLLLSQHLESAHLAELVGQGARGIGYLLKGRVTGPVFLDAVNRVASDGCAFDPDVVTAMLNRPRVDDELTGLTSREREVLSLMAQGSSNGAIALELYLTTKTVETHIRRIFRTLRLPEEADHNRRVLAVLAYLRST